MKPLTIFKNQVIYSMACSLFFAGMGNIHAQVLSQSVRKIRSLKNISYTDVVSTKFSFEKGFSSDTLRSQVFIIPEKSSIQGYYLIKGRDHSYAYDGNKMVHLNLADSTYKVQKESVSGQYTRSLLYWANEWEKLTGQPTGKVLQLTDTLIDNTPYAHIKVTGFDSTANNGHVYSVTNIVMDKQTKLPFLISWKIRDMADDGTFVGLVENHVYSKYEPDKKGFPDLSVANIPDYFKLPPRRQPVEYLPNGTPAPQLMIHDLAGKALKLADLKGKVVLLSFSLVGCPHSVGASQMLNRLYDKYGNEVMILNIYPMDQAESIKDFDKRENIKTASFTSEKTVVNDFPIDGYPSFYLLDRAGIIVQSYSGFFKGLESQVVAKIDEISEAKAAGQ